MKGSIITLLVCTIFSIGCAQKTAITTAATTKMNSNMVNEDGWISLFNGENLIGWHGYNHFEPTQWSAVNGELVFTPSKDQTYNQNLVTNGVYKDFILSIDWKISEGGNSGIMWGVVERPDIKEPYITGPEIQVLDDERHPDAKQGGGTHVAGSLYDMRAPSKDATKPAGEWNNFVITINYTHNYGSVVYNGELVNEFPVRGVEWDAMVANSKFKNTPIFGASSTGKIVLQDHHDIVHYRNIKIKPLNQSIFDHVGKVTEVISDPAVTEFYEPVPPKVSFDKNNVPSDAIKLFDGSNLDHWRSANDPTKPADWIVNGDGSMSVKNRAGNIQTKESFGSMQLHLEWKNPAVPRADGQTRANSGMFFQGRYEVQILDNYDNPTYVNGQVGSIYKQHIPLTNPVKASGEWQVYDIIYHAPEFGSKGELTKAGTFTVLLNGVLVQDNVEIQGVIQYIGLPTNEAHGKAPLVLQDHGDNSGVSFRNIWVRELE